MQSNLPNDSVARVSKSIGLNNVAIRRARRLATLLQRASKRSLSYNILACSSCRFVPGPDAIQAAHSKNRGPTKRCCLRLFICGSCAAASFHLLSDRSHYAGMHATIRIRLCACEPWGANAFSPGVPRHWHLANKWKTLFITCKCGGGYEYRETPRVTFEAQTHVWNVLQGYVRLVYLQERLFERQSVWCK